MEIAYDYICQKNMKKRLYNVLYGINKNLLLANDYINQVVYLAQL